MTPSGAGWTLPPSPPLEPAPAPPSTAPGPAGLGFGVGGLPGGGLPPAPPPGPPRRRSAGRTIASSALAGFMVALAVTGAAHLPHGLRPTLDSTAMATAPAASAPATNSPSSVTTSAGATVAEIAESVNASLVDVNTSLGGGLAGAGTGMIIKADGTILTNYHVIEGARSIKVRLVSTNRSYTATVVGSDPSHDVAVIRIRGGSGLQPIALGDSSDVGTGDGVVAIGNALGSGGAPEIATGVVTALNRTVTATDEDGSNAETLTGLIETSAALQPGYSGGPLLNLSGEVVGIDTAASSGGGSRRFRATSGGGMAIPINQALAIAKRLGA